MLKRFETEYVLSSLNYISQTERLMRSEMDRMHLGTDRTFNLVGNNQLENLLGCLHNLEKARVDYGIVGLKSALLEVKDWLGRLKDPTALNRDDTVHTHSVLYGLHVTALNVLDDMSIFVLTRGSADYVVGDKVGFGDKVETAFPSSRYDAQEASKCLGLERWTACVMHCMRAMEPALQALENAVQVTVPKEQWGDKINQIEAAIKRMNKSTHSKDDVQWFSDAATQFHFVKTAWRNYAHHLLHTYDEEGATEIYDAARRFMKHLSTRLAESV